MKRQKRAFLHEEVGETSTSQIHLRAGRDKVVNSLLLSKINLVPHMKTTVYFILPPAHISKFLVSKSSPVTPA